MSNQDNQYSIYLRSTKQRITCTKQQFDDYYREIDNFRRKQQRQKGNGISFFTRYDVHVKRP